MQRDFFFPLPVSELQSSWLHRSSSASWTASVQYFLYLFPNAWEKHDQRRQYDKERGFLRLFHFSMNVTTHRFDVAAPAEERETPLLSRSAFSSGSGKASGWGLSGFKVSFKARQLAELTQKPSLATDRKAGKGTGFVMMCWSLKSVQLSGDQRGAEGCLWASGSGF